MSAIDVIPAAREHRAFVLDSFRECLGDLTGPHVWNQQAHVVELERDSRGRGNIIVATPLGHPETYLGWAAECWGSLVFAYVPQRLRRLGIARQMAAALFAGGPVRLVYWTDAAEEIREHGFPLVHDWREFARRQRFAERTPRPQHTERAA